LASDDAAPNLDHDILIPMMAGERIVAFARPGKPPENCFFVADRPRSTQNMPLISIVLQNLSGGA
jgi:hypothetical protein